MRFMYADLKTEIKYFRRLQGKTTMAAQFITLLLDFTYHLMQNKGYSICCIFLRTIFAQTVYNNYYFKLSLKTSYTLNINIIT